ncbi:hypothetical protein ACFQS7_02075 [Dankookia sp. GCM10030260]|uniref:hypothetical protein n=1 Tax=Dankookia sp. GCM10030260 TaxID=3273390 RepID=UPI003616634B
MDLDSDPTKLVEVRETGKQPLITRGTLTIVSVAIDVATCLASLPMIIAASRPEQEVPNVMRLASPESAILEAAIFPALTIVALVPLALRGVACVPVGAAAPRCLILAVQGLGRRRGGRPQHRIVDFLPGLAVPLACAGAWPAWLSRPGPAAAATG